MAFLFSREKRVTYARKIKGFWEEFSRKKIGLLGLAMVMTYVLVAIFAPLLTPYDPRSTEQLAQSFAKPAWLTIFPQYKDLATTQRDSLYWNIEKGSDFIQSYGKIVVVRYEGEGTEPVDVQLSAKFDYVSIPPTDFYMKFTWGSADIEDMKYSLRISLLTPDGEKYSPISPLYMLSLDESSGEILTAQSVDPFFRERLGYEKHKNPSPDIFSQKGEYTYVLDIRFYPKSDTAKGEVTFENAESVILGHVHGVLGCDYAGVDIWTQLVYGTRISLQIGLLAAGIGAFIGILVGVMTGYLGGIVDELMMRIVDILLCLPFLPLLLTLVFLFGKNIFYIVLFIALFGWQGLSRIIRSRTLSLRETAFVECARASGASRFYIITKHLVPNVLPIAFASLVLSVPAAILFEAALSFLGFGDPRVPTWGKMLHHAFGFGAFTQLAWWWLLPPGLAITTLCLAFVFMGHALDEVVNPRLRRRR